MPTCTPESVLASGPTFQSTDARGLQLARVALLWLQNGSTGTANSLYATGAIFDACDQGQLEFCRTTQLWINDALPNVPGLMTAAAAYQGVSNALQAMCQTISQWIEQGKPGTINTVMATAAKFQSLSDKQLTIVEIVLLQSIHGGTSSPSQLLNTAQTNGFLKLDSRQLMMLNAYLYCQLS